MKRIFLLVAVLLSVAPAHADDDPALPDGGSIVTPADGGSTVTVDLGDHASCHLVAVKCEGAQSSRYVTCATDTISIVSSQGIHSCKAASHNQLLEYDRTFDIPLNCKLGKDPKRYLSFTTDDGGVPFCKVQYP